MKILIVDDDIISRQVLKKILSQYGEVDMAANGKIGFEAFKEAMAIGRAYDLICLDILMPEMDGHTTLRSIRRFESENGIPGGDGVKIIMTSVLNDAKNILEAYNSHCEAYLVKPIEVEKIEKQLKKFNMLK